MPVIRYVMKKETIVFKIDAGRGGVKK